MERSAFVSALTQLKELASLQGNMITSQQLEEQLAVLKLDEEQKNLVLQYLNDARIGINEPVDPDQYIVGEDRNYLDLYLEELKMLPPCSQGKREGLLLAAMSGEKDVREELMQSFLAQVVDVAKLYVGQGVLLEDLIGEGNVALAVVIDMLGSQESAAEAEEMIIQMVMRAMEELVYENHEEQSEMEEILEKANIILEKANELADSLMRKVSLQEVCNETGFKEEEIREILRITGWTVEVIEL